MSSETPVDAAPEKMSAAGSGRGPCSDKIATFYVTHPAKVFWSGILALFALAVPAQDMASFSAQSTHEYTVTESSPAREFDSTDIAMKAVDSLSTTANSSQYRPRAFPSSQWGQFTAMYGWDKATAKDPDSTIFTARSVQQICQMEQAMFDHKDYPDFCVIDYD